MDLEILEYTGCDYRPLVAYESWRVAMLNFGERFRKVTKLERHMLTDEVFVLLHGEATLYIGKEQTPYRMEKNKVFNVKHAVWHAITTSEDAHVLVVENDNTSKDNSEYMDV